MTHLAISRRTDAVSRVEGDETLVLDLKTQVAHCLSGDVATVWNSAETSIEAIVAATGLSLEAASAASKSLVELGLVELPGGLSRRMLVRGAAVGGAVVAVGVVSMPLPAAALAASATWTVSKTGCTSGNSHKVTYDINISGPLAKSASYTVHVYYTGAGGAATDTWTITTDANGVVSGNTGLTTGSKVTATTSVTLDASNANAPHDKTGIPTPVSAGSFTGC